MDREAEMYILDHSSPEDPLLAELYRFTHLNVINPNMVSGHLQGLFLEFLVYMLKPSLVLEIGTYTGYSAISMARALPEGGVLHTIDNNDELSVVSTTFFERSGISDKIIAHIGKAQEIVPALNLKFDLIFIDGDKREYIEYYNLAIDSLASGGIILADNVLWGGKVTTGETRDQQTRGIMEFNEMVKNDTRVQKVILPIRDGMSMIRMVNLL
jgi:caffeoyl-CoA O-methyltransferase